MSHASEKLPLKTVSTIFKEQKKMEEAIQTLIDRSLPKDNISIIGNLQSETRICGFVTKKELILDGLAMGAIYGSLFGSILGLLTGVGVLFIPVLGTMVVAGPLGAALLGAASGAIYGSFGAGLGSALITMGMPEEKAAIYEKRLKAGEFLVLVEVPQEKTNELVSLLERIGAEEVAITNTKIPRQPEGELADTQQISPEIKANLSQEAQKNFVEAYNQSLKESKDKNNALYKAWKRIKNLFDRDEKGIYSKRKVGMHA
jgi:hypothetical protein